MFLFICSDFFVGVYQAINWMGSLQPHRQQSGRSELLFRSNLVSIPILLTRIAFHVSHFATNRKIISFFFRVGILKSWSHTRKIASTYGLRHLRKLLPILRLRCVIIEISLLSWERTLLHAFFGALAAWLICSFEWISFFITQLDHKAMTYVQSEEITYSLTVWQY